jgi:hypothetical protein
MFINKKKIQFDRCPHVGQFYEDEYNVHRDRVVMLWTGLYWLMMRPACIFEHENDLNFFVPSFKTYKYLDVIVAVST